MKDWTDSFGEFIDRMRANVNDAKMLDEQASRIKALREQPDEDYEVCPLCGETIEVNQ